MTRILVCAVLYLILPLLQAPALPRCSMLQPLDRQLHEYLVLALCDWSTVTTPFEVERLTIAKI